MANNKVVFGEEVLIDLTQDTVTPYALEEGYTAHAPSGEKIVGVMKPNKPVEVETNAEMTAISTGATEKDLGKVYLFVGEDDGVFEKDALYILVKKGTGYGFQRYAIGGSGEESTPLQEKTVEVTENGTTEVLPDEGYGLSKVIVTTNVAGGEDLDAELNEQEALIAELKEKLANGGGSCGSCIIDVTELPTGYKDVNVYARFDESNYMTFLQLFQAEGLNPAITYYVVDELPTEGTVTDFNTLALIYVYIANNTPYAYGDVGYGNMWLPISTLMTEIADMTLPDKGFTSDITAETEAGIYVTYKEGEKPVEGVVYRLTKSGAEVYAVNANGTHESLSDFVGGNSFETKAYVVETLPEYLPAPTDSVMHVYVVDSTGVAYINTGVDAWGVMSLGAYFTALSQAFGGSATVIDGGWTDNVAAETVYGCYCVRVPSVSLNIFANGVWESYIDDEVIASLEEENATLEAENETLNAELVNSSNFAKSVLSGSGVPSHVDLSKYNLTSIGGFAYDNLVNITIPDGVIEISSYAFIGCHFLREVVIPEGVRSIGKSAFDDCWALASITLPNSVRSIGETAFANNNSLTWFELPHGVTDIPFGCFQYCFSLANVTLPNTITHISQNAFNASIKHLAIAFNGTKAQWKAIAFAGGWNNGITDYTITCTDGTIAKNGTET